MDVHPTMDSRCGLSIPLGYILALVYEMMHGCEICRDEKVQKGVRHPADEKKTSALSGITKNIRWLSITILGL